jgi:hypothetical protein
MVELRTFRVGGGGGLLVAVRGLIDRASVRLVAEELERHDRPIVDLLRAEVDGPEQLHAVVAAAGTGATFVAEPPLADELLHRATGIRLVTSVASALAA